MRVDLFPARVRFVKEDGTLTAEAKRAFRPVEQVVNGISGDYVPITREINGYPLSADVTLDYTDVGADASGTAAASMTAHLAAGDPHPQYLTPAEGDAAYQPKDADLTSWAGVTRASGFDAFSATPSSANLAALVTDETGSGALVFATSPTLVTPILGTPTSGNLANCTFPTLNQNTTGTASNVTGVVAVANGGTGDTGTAWSTYTPTVTPSSGSFTTVSATGRYKQLGKTLFLNIVITITTNGTAAGFITTTMPTGITPADYPTLTGQERAIAGFLLRSRATPSSGSIEIWKHDNSYPGGDGHVLTLSGVIEIT
jgi:hypothetical protein